MPGRRDSWERLSIQPIGKVIARTTFDGRTVVDPRKLLADEDVRALVERMAESAKLERNRRRSPAGE